MADYTSQTEMENEYGTFNIKAWSNLDNTTDAVNSTRITSAIAYAQAYINDRFRGGPYTLPLTVTTTIKRWASIIAGWWLYRARGLQDEDEIADKNQERKDEVDQQISATLAFQRRPDTAFAETMPTAPIVS